MVLVSTLLTLIQNSPTQEQQQLFKPRFTLHKHSSFVNCVSFSPDGKQLYTAGRDAKLNIWNLKNGQLQSTRRNHTDSIEFIVVSPTKTQFLTGARDGTLKFWNTKDASLKHTLNHFITTKGPHYVGPLSFSPNGKYVVSTGRSHGELIIWNAQTYQKVRTIKASSNLLPDATFSPDSASLVGTSSEKTINFWNLATGKVTKSIKTKSIDTKSKIQDLGFSPTGTMFTVQTDELTIYNSISLQKQLSIPNMKEASEFCFSKDSRKLIINTREKAEVWDTHSGKRLITLQGHTDLITCIAFSPDNQLIATGSEDQTVKIWNATTGNLVQTLQSTGWAVNVLTFSPDGKTLAAGVGNGKVEIWQKTH
jgi:WD40 repeat protein